MIVPVPRANNEARIFASNWNGMQFKDPQYFIDKDHLALAKLTIITPSGNMQRPDRVMISGKHAIVIDYKFGHEQPTSHLEQVRDYMSLLRQMGYTTEGYIIYNALQTIHSI